MWGFLKRLTCAKVQTLTPLPAKRGAATDGDAAAAGADTRRRQRDQQAGPVDTAPPGTPKGGAAVRAPPDQEMLLLTPVPTAPPRGAAAPSTPATAECRTPAAAVGQPCQQQRRQQREPRSASAACSSCAPSRSATGRLSSGFLIEGGKVGHWLPSPGWEVAARVTCCLGGRKGSENLLPRLLPPASDTRLHGAARILCCS